ncbi:MULTISPECIES: hypothetical protein [unclassified Prevotella]|uniref:hypothetical protein n=1 Tax=unclassified Prevotella TaxID=2638335 RepID=UPI00048B44C2|nr:MULTISPECIES: hypothetical protein [unclassified Prevotella]
MIRNIIIGSLSMLLVVAIAIGLYMHHSDNERISELESQINALRKKEKQSEVDRRVSKQMEEIAYGQQVLSEERSREAILQSEIAQKMTLRSEAERQKAIQAQGFAELSAQEAIDAYQMAESQRRQAEHAKQVTDTLNYISLGRTLGSQSYAIFQTGDTELGNILAYASYQYTKDYNGDLYAPAVFQALIQSAGGRQNFNIHNGSITCIETSPNNDRLLTVSTYGEIYAHKMQGNQMQTTRLMSDKHYCFRDAFSSKNGKDYVISHTGHLVVIEQNHPRIVTLENMERPFSLKLMNNGRQLLIISENSLALLDITTDRIIGMRQLNFRVSCTGRRDNKPLLFDNKGYMHLVNGLDKMTNEKVPVQGLVTAFASSANEHLSAYGMNDGIIWLVDKHGKMHKLAGHLSKITKMKINGRRLYSSSYDGKLLFWMTGDTQITPITLFQSGSWLTNFTFSNDKDYIWTGNYNGTMTRYLISLKQIAQRIRQKVNRNLTQEEWNYYVGKGIPYKKLIVEN